MPAWSPGRQLCLFVLIAVFLLSPLRGQELAAIPPIPPDYHFVVVPNLTELEVMLNEAAQRGDRLVLLSEAHYSPAMLALMRGGNTLQPYSYVVVEAAAKDIAARVQEYNALGYRVMTEVQVPPLRRAVRVKNIPMALLMEREPTPAKEKREYLAIAQVTAISARSMFTLKSYLTPELAQADQEGFSLIYVSSAGMFLNGLSEKEPQHIQHGYFREGGLKHIRERLAKEGERGCWAGLVYNVLVRCDYKDGKTFAYEYVHKRRYGELLAEITKVGALGYRFIPVSHLSLDGSTAEEPGTILVKTDTPYEYRSASSKDVVELAREMRKLALQGFTPVWLIAGPENHVLMERRKLPDAPVAEVKP